MRTTLQEPRTIQPKTREAGAGDRTKLVKSLNQRLAAAIDLQLQAKQAHWNVKGPKFSALHELFEQVAVKVAHHSDLIAERAVQLGGLAEGLVPTVAKQSDLPGFPTGITAGADHVRAMTGALSAFGAKTRPGIAEAADAGDPITEDILVEVSRDIDKLLWLVEAHAQTESFEEAER
ncbi:MAG: DNA starvation/stationary phase protection protein Dps [Gemmatimonadales bacterium]